MTNVKKASWLTHYFGLNNFKQSQSEDNRKAILDALAALGQAQVDQIYDHLLKINQQDAQTLYEYGTITGNQKKEFIKEHTMHKRTIHRHLNNLTKSGLVELISHKYLLADKVKKDVAYWARDFGDTLLYKLMRSYSPHKFRFEENIEELMKIFGFYALCCLVQAARPPIGNNDGKISETDIMNRDRLIVTWIKQVFNPQRMLDYLLAIMSNLDEDNNASADENKHNFRLENASDMRSERWMWFLLTSKDYDKATKPYYELDIGTINKIMQILEKKYKSYYKPLAEVTKNNDIIEMTKNSEMNMIKWLCLNDKNVH